MAENAKEPVMQAIGIRNPRQNLVKFTGPLDKSDLDEYGSRAASQVVDELCLV
jgi:hypothetical protein